MQSLNTSEIVILVVVVVIPIVWNVVKSLKNKNSGKAASDSYVGSSFLKKLKEAIPNPKPILVTAVSLLFLNFLLWGLTEKMRGIWDWYWGDSWHGSLFFWVFNLGWLLVATLSTLKGEDKKITSTAANIRKAVFAIMVLGFFSNFSYEETATPAGRDIQNHLRVTGPQILEIIAGCESGDGTPGSGRQFEDDGLPVRNPYNEKAVGKWQINLADTAVARLVEEKGWDVENSESDNRLAAEHLYREGGTIDWTASSNCWIPQLESSGVIYTSETVVAPNDDWSSRIPIPSGSVMDLVEKEGSILIRSNKGEIVEQNLAEGKRAVFTKKSSFVQIQSMGSEPIEVTVMISPKRR